MNPLPFTLDGFLLASIFALAALATAATVIWLWLALFVPIRSYPCNPWLKFFRPVFDFFARIFLLTLRPVLVLSAYLTYFAVCFFLRCLRCLL